MVEAGKKTLLEIRHSRTMPSDVQSALFKNYVDAIYKKDFEDRIQDTPVHHKDADHADIHGIMDDIRPHVDRGRDEFVTQLIKHHDVNKLKRPSRLKEPILTISDEAW